MRCVPALLTAAALLFDSGTYAGLPQCQTSIGTCIAERTSGTFSDDYISATSSFRAVAPAEMCNATQWARADQCYSSCPLRLTVTEPASLAMHLCLQDNVFQPTLLEGHVDENHRLQGLELEVIGVGNPLSGGDTSSQGCDPSDYSAVPGKAYAGKIVIVRRGGCKFITKARQGELAGAAAVLVLNNQVTSHEPNNIASQFVSMSGSSEGMDGIVIAALQNVGGDNVIAALDNGVGVRGHLKLQCTPDNEPDEYVDECPDLADAVVSQFSQGCNFVEDSADNICGRCDARIRPGSTPDSPFFFCLRGNDLRPRRKAHNIAQGRALPFTVDSAVYLADSACNVTQYATHKGMVVFIRRPLDCLLITVVQAAQEAGVLGIVSVPREGDVTVKLPGLSALVKIYVNSIAAASAAGFDAWATHVGEAVGGTAAVSLPPLLFEADTYTAYIPPEPEPTLFVQEEVELEAKPFWQWSTVLIVSLAMTVVLLLAIIAKFVHQRIRAVKLPDDEGAARLQIPLSLASMGLSVALLIAISTTAFTLAHAAGQSSTDTARRAGQSAVDATLANAVTSVEDVNSRWMASLLDLLSEAAQRFFEEPRIAGLAMKDTMRLYDGEYATFAAYWMPLKSLEESMGSAWRIAVRTKKERFYMDGIYRSDDRSDALRNDGQPHISVTKDGSRYGHYQLKELLGSFIINGITPRAEWDPMSRIGCWFGDTFAEVEGARNSPLPAVWRLDTYTSPDGAASMEHPVVLLLPVVSSSGALLGTVELQRTMSDVSRYFAHYLAYAPGVQNVTTLCYAKGVLLSASGGAYREVDRYLETSYKSAHESLTLSTTNTIEIRALGEYARVTPVRGSPGEVVGNLVSASGAFEQQEYFKDNDGWDVWHYDFSSGSGVSGAFLHDLAGNGYRASLGGGAAMADGVLDLRGGGMLTVYAYLTPDVPRVARTATSLDPWGSSFPLYRHVNQSAEGMQVIASYDRLAGKWNPVLREPIVSQDIAIAVRLNPHAAISPISRLHGTEPRIFSDTASGDAAIRWFANGRLMVSTRSLGCTTDPLPNGPPVHAWTHMVAAVDWKRGVCRVFVNGSLHSEKMMSAQSSRTSYTEHYRVGEFYNGLLDDLRVLSISPTPLEALHLFEKGFFKKEVPQKRWKFVFRKLSTGGHTPLVLTIGLLLPEADVLREVLANNEVTLRNLHAHEQNTQQDLDLKINESIFVLVVIALFSVLLFLVFNELLTQPFSRFACQLTDAAVLKVDDDAREVHFFIAELNALHKAMGLMIRNLREYRSYMPRTLLEGDEDTSGLDDSPNACPAFHGIATEPGAASALSGGSAPKTHSSGASDDPSRGTTSPGNSQEHVNMNVANARMLKQAMSVLHLARRKVSFVVANIVDFYELFNTPQAQAPGNKGAYVVDIHSAVVEAALCVFQTCKGVPETFSGDRMLCSFNAVKNIAAYRSAAAQALLLLEARVAGLPHSVKLSLSGVSGEVRTGNMGTELMKRFSCISPVVTWAFALERYAKHVGASNLIDNMEQDLRLEFVTQVYGSVMFKKKREARPIRVSRVMTARAQHNVEWMYQLDETERHDPYGIWNEACKLLFKEEFEASSKLFERLTEDVDPALLDRFRGLAVAETFEPTEILFH